MGRKAEFRKALSMPGLLAQMWRCFEAVEGEEKTQRLARQHLAVDRGDLVRQRFDAGGVDRDIRVEEMGKPDALGLRGQPEQPAVRGEGPTRAWTRSGFAGVCPFGRHVSIPPASIELPLPFDTNHQAIQHIRRIGPYGNPSA